MKPESARFVGHFRFRGSNLFVSCSSRDMERGDGDERAPRLLFSIFGRLRRNKNYFDLGIPLVYNEYKSSTQSKTHFAPLMESSFRLGAFFRPKSGDRVLHVGDEGRVGPERLAQVATSPRTSSPSQRYLCLAGVLPAYALPVSFCSLPDDHRVKPMLLLDPAR